MSDPMVTTEWLAQRLGDPTVKVVDATLFMPGDPRDANALFNRRILDTSVLIYRLADGTVVASWGDIDTPILPRSANKPIQAMAFVADPRGRAYAGRLPLEQVAHVVARAAGLDDASAWVDEHRRGWNERFDLLDERLRELKQRRPKKEKDNE